MFGQLVNETAGVVRFTIIDVNPYHYNCGHYPEWEVREAPTGEYESRADAQTEADRRNARSTAAWQSFLDC